jgi:hypothetical protein
VLSSFFFLGLLWRGWCNYYCLFFCLIYYEENNNNVLVVFFPCFTMKKTTTTMSSSYVLPFLQIRRWQGCCSCSLYCHIFFLHVVINSYQYSFQKE